MGEVVHHNILEFRLASSIIYQKQGSIITYAEIETNGNLGGRAAGMCGYGGVYGVAYGEAGCCAAAPAGVFFVC